MKKIISVFLCLVFMFALLLELTDAPDWSWRAYITNVTENIEELPTIDLTYTPGADVSTWENIGDFFSWLGDLLIYPIRFVFVLVHNVWVVFSGFLPFNTHIDSGIPDGIGGGFGGVR